MTGASAARPAGLSETEVRVLALIGMGLENAEIATLLGIGRSTLKSHIRRAYRRIGVATREEAMAWVAAGQSPRRRRAETLERAGS